MATQSINVADLDGENGFAVVGARRRDSSGVFVSSAGDVNGDGFDDVIISDRYGYSYNSSSSYVVFGKAAGFDATLNLSSLDGANGFRLNGGQYGGSWISDAGDVNGDGFDDVIVGVPFNHSGYSFGYMVFGKAAGFDAAMNLSDLDGSNGFRLDGVPAYDNLGWSVSGAGDVNGDGVDDVIISTWDFNKEASYIVFGKLSGFDATMNLSTLDGSNGFRLDGAGYLVSGAGDVNGDGFDDVMVSSGLTHHVVFGKASGFDAAMHLSDLDGSNGFRLDSEAVYLNQGVFASDAGDVNGDGFDDLIIGNLTADLNGRDSGSSYVVFGKASGFDATMNLSDLDGNNGFRLDGATINDRSGSSVSGAGDVNGDGFNDLIIGASGANPDGSVTGSSYVVFGRATGFDAAMSLSVLDGDNKGFRIDGASFQDLLGWSVSGAGDVNGDGFDDLIVGAPYADSNGDDSGSSYIIFGRSEFTGGGVDFPAPPEVRPTTTSINLSSLDGSNGFRLDSTGYYQGGFSISSAGDMNGDGFDDMAISTFFEKYYEGSYVVFGKSSGFDPSMNLIELDGENGFRVNVATNDSSVEGIGDINGDGFDDVVVIEEARDNYYGNVVVNNAYIVLGKASGFSSRLDLSGLDGSNGFRLDEGTEHEFLGVSISGAGDVNGDGFDDFVIGNHAADPNGNSSGSTYVVFGNSSGFNATLSLSDLDGSNGFRLDGVTAGDGSGGSVSGVGDINGDGLDDVMIGAGGADPNGYLSGSSYVVFGKAAGFDAVMNLAVLDGQNGFRLNGAEGGDITSSVRTAGDVNGDGLNDALVSGRNSGSYVVFGKATGFDAAIELSDLDGSNGFHVSEAGLVISVSSAGDVNGDGFDDLIIGNSSADPNGDDSGSSYVMFGKASGFEDEIKLSDLDSTNSVRLDGVAARDRSGVSVSTAGDVNSDGFDDLMVSAPDTNVNNDNSGSVYVIFGTSQFNGVVTYVGLPEIDDVFTGTAAAEHFDPSDGNDLLIGGGGADVIYGGIDDDTIRVSDLDFQLIDGGSGNDTLGLDGSGMNLDLANTQGKISGIETIDLSGKGNNTLTLNTAGLLALPSDTPGALIVKGDIGDEVTVSGNRWVDGGIQDSFHTYMQNGAVLKVDTAVRVDFSDVGIINLSSLNGSNGFRMDGVGARDELGRLVSDAGDVNGDGFDDLMVGTPFADSNGLSSGSSYVVFGKAAGFEGIMNLSELDGNNGFRLDGIKNGDWSSDSFSNAGDVNGDGFDDLIIGAYRAGNSSGSSYVVFGKASGFDAAMNLSDLDGSNGFRLNGVAAGDDSGRSVSGAGDVNGDGFDDLLIGASRADPNGSSSGSIYVVFGKASGFGSTMNLSDLEGNNGFRLDGVKDRGYAGTSVSGTGDVNGDGLDDLLVGGLSSNYVVFGKTSGFDATMNLSDLEGSNGFHLDGPGRSASISSAGDVNGDGFDDLVIGYPFASLSGSNIGATCVVFGKASGFDASMNLSNLDGSNGFRVDGVVEYDFLGRSVSNAGDVNGDGFDDLIIGAAGSPNGIPGAGSSYVLFGKASGFDAVFNVSNLGGTNGFRLDGVAAGDGSGGSVSAAGDVNGDGFDDLLIGAPNAAPNGRYSGSSYVIFGRSDFAGDEVDFPGTPGDDIFTGTSAAESFEGGDGNDRMIGRGGADSFDGGAGNDYIRILGDDFQHVDGGTGTDTLGFAGSGFNLDLPNVIDNIHGIETIALYGVGDNTLTLTAQDVIDLSGETNTLKIKGNAGDSVVGLSGGWEDVGVHGNFHTFAQGEAVLLIGVDVTTDFPII
ncbi:FG-GAP repeat protein [Nitrosomonas ureae]|uniref:FG-GAP repeat-containing protein n=1 Tax=Nitrosomonas ureae TaxID=44577 RepID=A0A1H2HL10_9PROT|nr:FG-GAP repeat protein [Nitrosomonas ureae]SDU32533.1 FG-GAP repeat-containing protein [Nitrosomonas ureae]